MVRSLDEYVILWFTFLSYGKGLAEIRKERFHLAAVGTLSALMTVFQMLAVSQTLVVYVVAIKRLTILFSIILGGLIFKEKNIGSKLAGGAIMVLGVLLITF